MDYIVHVVSYARSARAGYLPFQEARLEMVESIDHLLDILDIEPEFGSFFLGGESDVFNDYLELRRRNRERLLQHISEGRIQVGPWYSMPDGSLCGCESIVRNLFLGHRTAEGLGLAPAVGYLSDASGCPSQMPQILAEFGIESVLLPRQISEMTDERAEIVWGSSDGSSVLGSTSIFCIDFFPSDVEIAREQVARILKFAAHHASTRQIIILLGDESLDPQDDLPKILAQVNEGLEGARIVQSTLPEYFAALRKDLAESGRTLRRIEGSIPTCPPAYPTISLKQAAGEAETFLARYAEPFSTFAWIEGREYPSSELRYAWKLLLKGESETASEGAPAHESINLCDQARQIGAALAERAAEYISERIDTSEATIVVLNPLSWARTDRVIAEVDLPFTGSDMDGIEIVDPLDNPVMFKLLALWDLDGDEDSPAARRFVVELLAEDVPPCGFKAFSVRSSNIRHHVENRISVTPASISNDILTLTCVEGAGIRVGCNCGHGFEFGALRDVGDIGSRVGEFLLRDRAITFQITDVEIADDSPVSATLTTHSRASVPPSRSNDGQGRSRDAVQLNVSCSYTITSGSPRIEVEAHVEGYAEDHRLSMLFPAGDLKVSSLLDAARYSEKEIAEISIPLNSWFEILRESPAITVAGRGLPDLCLEAGGTAVTIDRSSSDEEEPHPSNVRKARFAIIPHREEWTEALSWRAAQEFEAPLVWVQTLAHEGSLPMEYSFVDVSAPELVVTAIKKADDRGSAILRFFSTAQDLIHDTRIMVDKATGVNSVNLNEKIGANLLMEEDGSTIVDVPGRKLASLEFIFEQPVGQ